MTQMKIRLAAINDVKEFVNIAGRYSYDIDITVGKYVVDAKSIMGIFSLDLSKPIDFAIYGDENVDEILEVVKKYEA